MTNLERFDSKHKFNSVTGCDEWTAGLNTYGYGAFGFNGITQSASRVAWELKVGPIPAGLCVLHKCDNRKCVDIAHLYLGTVQDNNWDKIARGRSNKELNSRKRVGKRMGGLR